MNGFAEDYGAVLDRRITCVPDDVDTWNKTYIDGSVLVAYLHTAEHLKALTRLIAGGHYGGVPDQMETLLGQPSKTMRWALENHPRIQKLATISGGEHD
jgi:hypothetical protein